MITKKEFIEMFSPVGERIEKDKILVVDGAPQENLRRAFEEIIGNKNSKCVKKEFKKEDPMNIFLESKGKKMRRK